MTHSSQQQLCNILETVDSHASDFTHPFGVGRLIARLQDFVGEAYGSDGIMMMYAACQQDNSPVDEMLWGSSRARFAELAQLAQDLQKNED